ncbi:MAG TPA: hypothetical protein VFT22_28290 [Kofleriaceae bacterium]|nr:hypothetical protein [Kofleriaceae bacterium]
MSSSIYTAGALELSTIDKVDGPTLWVSGGAPLAGPGAFDHHDRRLVGMASPPLRGGGRDRALVAAQVADTDGPFEHRQRFRQGNALVQWQGPVGPGDLQREATWYAARWNASGQVPDGSLGAARSRLVQNAGNSNAIALAPRLMGQGGATPVHGAALVSLRGRGIADRPGNADGTLTAPGYLIFDLVAGRSFGQLDVRLTVVNLANTRGARPSSPHRRR